MSLQALFVGALLSAVVALLLLLLVRRERRAGVVATAAGAALLMPMAWNSVLNLTGAIGLFSHDLPFPPFPVSWQDAGTGVFTLAGAAVALMAGPCRRDAAGSVAGTAALTALVALLVDVYLY
ncbi:hypothetical protein J7I84_02140 [Arthrobacter sp. ISL-85]|uniref:hypothetical protein n=1 Tax=Arthrobacter sp. ISL-85 TaxID=2819115 RepID=UPI001BEB1068|nr:hypothetical protein [Arthrobacter sp. ISL-85]MBT2565308.1 hypothetical protein [Arthrobacter sp. ISL-85]